ncbi:hypothetical protein BpHYR1_012152 [Brachionus plicatilis]|uniref:Uncharacterized protein n=1 Tax=Brachionus plicatilis TaxID=10195 RepID=A0A3M7R8A2_BRAPC|nr:hypothetical protein BpHYR1_012152 [Brachionus plicatilis]
MPGSNKDEKDNPNVIKALYNVDKSCHKFIKGVSQINSVLNKYASFMEISTPNYLYGQKSD